MKKIRYLILLFELSKSEIRIICNFFTKHTQHKRMIDFFNFNFFSSLTLEWVDSSPKCLPRWK